MAGPMVAEMAVLAVARSLPFHRTVPLLDHRRLMFPSEVADRRRPESQPATRSGIGSQPSGGQHPQDVSMGHQSAGRSRWALADTTEAPVSPPGDLLDGFAGRARVGPHRPP